MNKEENINNIKKSLDKLLNSETKISPKKLTKKDKDKDDFLKIILTLEELEIRSYFLENDLEIGIGSYEKKFYFVIDSLLEMHFGEKITEIIIFYLYARKKEDGSNIPLQDDAGNPIPLENANDLWNLVQILRSKK